MKKLITGDEAVARGAWEAGVKLAAAYPGTPSTEILENLSAFPEVISEWSSNEKVALETAIGASLAGGRAISSMKHVGLNVAADPLFTVSYTGSNAGLVVVVADEPGMFSSQNEQDSRNYAKAAKLPMLEPADSGECLEMTKYAFELSERYDTPVLLRMTTRVCHSKSVVELGERSEKPLAEYKRQGGKYVCVPAVSRKLRVKKEEQFAALAELSESTPLNFAVYNEGSTGVIVSGGCFHYAREVFGESVSYLKLGLTNPLPKKLVSDFCNKMDKVYIIEENDPYLEDFVKTLGIKPIGKDSFPYTGEMTPDVIRKAVFGESLPGVSYDKSKVAPRPPALCSGCPHRGFFYELGRRKDVMVTGDIGCYTLGASAPFNALDAVICMGASLSMGHGAAKLLDREGSNLKVVSLLGDSTFFHTGINSLLNSAYNGGSAVNVILDNRITGMTGHQENPGSGYTVNGESAYAVNIEDVARAFGIKHVRTVDPNNLAEVKAVLDEFIPLDEPSVIITRWPCALKKFSAEDKSEFPGAFTEKYAVDQSKCIGCKLCMKAGCPSLSFDTGKWRAVIDRSGCLGCGVCSQLCPKDAIGKENA
ncbi:MAG: indolepyruvate ferredoxin oxidoreductase subunit alpha [Oscillospiraceae bacterium]|nr:indolepyruvate ferredoxin oxidoreductase subunit alpha [Oscillospiraceae bacterium]